MSLTSQTKFDLWPPWQHERRAASSHAGSQQGCPGGGERTTLYLTAWRDFQTPRDSAHSPFTCPWPSWPCLVPAWFLPGLGPALPCPLTRATWSWAASYAGPGRGDSADGVPVARLPTQALQVTHRPLTVSKPRRGEGRGLEQRVGGGHLGRKKARSAPVPRRTSPRRCLAYDARLAAPGEVPPPPLTAPPWAPHSSSRRRLQVLPQRTCPTAPHRDMHVDKRAQPVTSAWLHGSGIGGRIFANFS